MRDVTITYAQNREDVLLAAFFRDDEIGFYVDVGAEAPTDLSVTKIFYNRGWHGINVEPIKRQYELFVDERPRDINLNVGISNSSGKLKFREYNGSGYSTFSRAIKKEHVVDDEKLVKEFKDYDVEVKTLEQIFIENGVRSIQFLKVDVEGFEYEVLDGNDWTKYRPEVICIEANHVQKDWRLLLKKKGYEYVFFDGLNEYYADTKTDRANEFDYVRKVVLRSPVVDYRVLEDVNEIATEAQRLKEELAESHRHNKALQSAINDITPLRRHVLKSGKRYLAAIDRRIVSRLSHDTSYSPVPLKETLTDSMSIEVTLSAAKEYDHTNYASYSQVRHDSPVLPLYLRMRSGVRKFARKTIRIIGGKL